ncbi:PAS domain-containing sensor histidine kinase [Rhodobacteraceae bacterium RKSG542]|uniref:two-component system sensor histidine kinase NtrB n=1 Tax=Pseudovibrio flavus TaxID=2529854 RepID=UPI0012BBE51E|nr:PAS domain-containing sensor histidine kinase [Pseudovibrio flavus]MTI18829.1 PAS domain-containing sensor histidine kinase [Pseudovibrio flavus]
MDSYARLHSVLATAVDGIVVIDADGKILVFNKACEDLFGYKAEEVVGKDVGIIMPGKDADHHQQFVQRYLDTGDKHIIGRGREVIACDRNGVNFPCELSVGEANTPHGRQFIGIIRDLRSKKEADARLSTLQADLIKMTRVNALDEMGAAIAHEVNQPLTAIMLYLQTAARRAKAVALEDDLLNSLMEKAVAEAARASEIIQRMRSFVEKQTIFREKRYLKEVIDECVELVSAGYQGSNVVIANEFANAEYEFALDTVQVQQILINLIRNGVEATKNSEERKVTVRASDDEDNVYIEVEDSGPGVTDASAQHLFKAFSGTKKRGLGVGLVISRSIAQNHGGDLTVKPYEEGRGAVFVLRLPKEISEIGTESAE